MTGGPVLAFDFGARVAAAAVASGGELVAGLEAERETRDADLLPLVERCLARAGLAPRELAGVVALAGPGSFTGLRVACATALGLGAALGVPASGFSTLAALALAAPPGAGPVLAVVDALRGEWFAQPFERTAAGLVELGPPRALAAGEPAPLSAGLLVGIEAGRFASERGWRGGVEEAPRAAEAAALAASRDGWRGDPALLRRPLYLRAPAVRLPAGPV